MIYGYARVSTTAQKLTGNGLDVQTEELKNNGAEVIYADAYTGKEIQRPEFSKLLAELKPGDRLVVCKLDRIARTATEGYELVEKLLQEDISVHVLNMGLLDNSLTGKLILHIMFAFAEFERSLIVERTSAGRAIAKEKGVQFGRKKKYTEAQISHAVELANTLSVKKASTLTGISESTIKRAKYGY